MTTKKLSTKKKTRSTTKTLRVPVPAPVASSFATGPQPAPPPATVTVSQSISPPGVIGGVINISGMTNPGTPVVTMFSGLSLSGVSGPNINPGPPPSFTYTVQPGSPICGAEVAIVVVVQDMANGNMAGSTLNVVVQCGP